MKFASFFPWKFAFIFLCLGLHMSTAINIRVVIEKFSPRVSTTPDTNIADLVETLNENVQENKTEKTNMSEPLNSEPKKIVFIMGGVSCPANMFECIPHICVTKHWICDGTINCLFGNDEKDCGNSISDTSPLNCSENEFQCQMGRCINASYVCDDEIDCEDGTDEFFCNDKPLTEVNLESTTTISTSTISTVSTFTTSTMNSVTNDEPPRRIRSKCSSNQFECKPGECIKQQWVCDGDKDCSNGADETECEKCKVQCQNKKCIESHQICNGVDDCGDGSDEKTCSYNFAVRLRAGAGPHEGRVEVRVYGEWGYVCSDQWDINDATVVCKQLGYSLGAITAFSVKSHLSPRNYMMSEINCFGNETSLHHCSFPGWQGNKCLSNQAAGVVCRLKNTKCKENEFRCDNNACIPITSMCDGDNDCGDDSDETRKRCKLPLQLKLVDGPSNSSGRVEIKRFDVWGTICDDDWDDKDARVICRMLGFNGPAKAIKGAKFGPGRGVIWLDDVDCLGNEESIDYCDGRPWGEQDCEHREDASVICSNRKEETVATTDLECGIRPLDSLRKSERLVALDSTNETSDENVSLESDVTIDDDSDVEMIHEKSILPIKSARIIGGKVTRYGEFPWQVGIYIKRFFFSEKFHCGASIIGEFYLLSAAHCFMGYSMRSIVVRVGDHDTRSKDFDEDDFEVAQVYIHPGYEDDEDYVLNDIAVVRLKPKRGGRGIRFGKYTQPVCLPSEDTIYISNTPCFISGWGHTGEYSRKDRYMQGAIVPLLPENVCRRPSVYGRRLKQGMFCAGYLEGGVDSCYGDSGGPLVAKIEGRFTLLGVVSWGEGCGYRNKPGIYAKVKHYLDWIHNMMA